MPEKKIVYANSIIKHPNTHKIWLDCPYCGKTHGHGMEDLRDLGTANASRGPDCGQGVPHADYIIDADRFTVYK